MAVGGAAAGGVQLPRGVDDAVCVRVTGAKGVEQPKVVPQLVGQAPAGGAVGGEGRGRRERVRDGRG